MSDCTRGDCDWPAWMGVAGIRDVLMRRCRTCGMLEQRILPPDVRPADTRRERGEPWMGYAAMVDAYGPPEEWGRDG